MSYIFDPQKIARLGEELTAGYQAAAPYPHAVIDEFLQPKHAQQLAQVFPTPADPIGWDSYGEPGYEMKLGCGREESFPDPLRRAFYELNSGPFVRFLERLTGIPHLLPDPHLAGGGLHLSRRGDHLGIHADFNWHEGLQAHRRLNLLIYLTPDWQPGYGGELELWDTQATRMQMRVPPLFNRAVIFATRSDTFHGHPNPWAAPNGINRQSIALYYYTVTRPDNEMRAAHSTLYKGLDVFSSCGSYARLRSAGTVVEAPCLLVDRGIIAQSIPSGFQHARLRSLRSRTTDSLERRSAAVA